METYHAMNEIQDSKCLKIVICIMFFLMYLIGFLIGNNMAIYEYDCLNVSNNLH